MNKEQLMKEIKRALNKWQSWNSFTVTKKGHGFEIEYVFSGVKDAMSLEDAVIFKHNAQNYGEQKREEISGFLGMDVGPDYGRVMENIREQAIEKFKSNQREYNSQRMK